MYSLTSNENFMTTQFTTIATPNHPFEFQDGSTLGTAKMAWKSWGKLSPEQDNVILLFPVLTTSHHASGFDAEGPGVKYWTPDCYYGWWDAFIGPNKALDTNRWWILCPSLLGGCYGSTGPACTNPKTGEIWGEGFPFPQISDLVNATVELLNRLGISQLHGVIGASFGGYLALDMALRYPQQVKNVMSIASGIRVTPAMQLANFQQATAIESHLAAQAHGASADTEDGDGLVLARMIAMQQYIVTEEVDTYCSQKVDKSLKKNGSFPLNQPLESWLLYQGKRFAQRFNAHSYLRLLHAWQNWKPGIDLQNPTALRSLKNCQHQNWLIFSIDSDACFPPVEQTLLANTLTASHIPNQLIKLSSRLGHDSFLREPDLYEPAMQHFLTTPLVNQPTTSISIPKYAFAK